MYGIFCTKSASKRQKKHPIFPTFSVLLLSFFSGFRGPRGTNGTLGTHGAGRTRLSGRTLGPHRADGADQPGSDLRPRPGSGTGFWTRTRPRLRPGFRSRRRAGIRRTRRGARGARGRAGRPAKLVKAAAGITFHRASFLRKTRDEDFRGQKARNSLYAGSGWGVRKHAVDLTSCHCKLRQNLLK